jgi:hypothetical protein
MFMNFQRYFKIWVSITVLCLLFLNGFDDHITSNPVLASVLFILTIYKAKKKKNHYSDLLTCAVLDKR